MYVFEAAITDSIRRSMCDIGFVPLGQKITRAMSHIDRVDSSPKRRSMCDIRTRFGGVKSTSNSHAIPFMLPKRRFWKSKQHVGRVVSIYFV
jgi:hypothetical protein